MKSSTKDGDQERNDRGLYDGAAGGSQGLEDKVLRDDAYDLKTVRDRGGRGVQSHVAG